MASEVPVPRSYQVILSDIVDTFRARYGIRKLKVGGPILTALEANAQSDLRSTQDIFNLLDLRDINRLTGAALDFVAADEGLTRLPATASTTKVNISDSTIERISSKIYSGAVAPVAGSSTIKVVSAESFPSSGTIYIGRGTTNIEGPITYTATTQFGTYWTLTLATTTQRYHNLNEDVVVGQNGDRSIPTGTLVATARDGRSSPIEFATTSDAVILDGEISIANVPAVCRIPGTSGNVPREAISVVSSSPFPGATCTNTQPVSSGIDIESDDKLRERLLLAKASRSRGTAYSILFNASGVYSAEESKRVVSTTIVTPAGEPATVYIDDGTGYEEKTEGVPYEVLMDSAFGGEAYFSLSGKRPISHAFAKTSLIAPFNLTSGCKLSVRVGGILSEHTFDTEDFTAISSALAAEIVSSINANPDILFSARTSDASSKVSIFARSETNEDLQVVTPVEGDDANDFLGFSTAVNYTTKLYKNDQLLYKDGLEAIINTAAQSFWTTMTSGIQIRIAVDGTPEVDYTFTDADFVDNNTGYTTLSKNNDIEAWATVFNAKVPGITARDGGGYLILTSNRGAKSTASIVISEPVSTDNLIQSGMFTVTQGLEASGLNRDYTLNRNTAQIKLFTPLIAEDTLTVGSFNTRAYAQSDSHDGGSIALSDVARLWITVDGNAEIVRTDISGITDFTTSNPAGAPARITQYTMNPAVTTLPSMYDWFVVWDTALAAHGAFRISSVGASSFTVRRPQASALETSVTLLNSGAVFVRSDSPVQEIRIPGGTQTLDTIVTIINDQLIGATASVYRGRYIRITSNSYDGDIMVVTADLEGQQIGFDTGILNTSSEPHLATLTAGSADISVPEFTDVGRILSDTVNLKTPQFTSTFGGTFNISSRLLFGLAAYDNATYPSVTPLMDQYRNIYSDNGTSFNTRQIQSSLVPIICEIAIGDLERASNVVTATTAVSHGFKVGDIVNVGPTGSNDVNFSTGNYAVTDVPTATTFTYDHTGIDAVSAQPYGVNLWEGPVTNDLVCLVNPYVVGPEDSLTVIMNNDSDTQAYQIPLFRRVALTGTPSSDLDITDTDNGGDPLSDAFGTDASFEDYWVFMHPRIVSHLGVTNKDIMWRLNRMGRYGDYWTIEYAYPSAQNSAIDFEVLVGNKINIYLPSGDLAPGTSLYTSTRFTSAVVASAGGYNITFSYSNPTILAANIARAANVVSVTTSTHGYAVGDVVYLSSTDPNFPPGAKIISVAGGTTFSYAESGAATTGVGTFSVSSAPVAPNFSSVNVNDIVHISSPNTSFVPQGNFRVTASTATTFTIFYPNSVSPGAMSTPQKLSNAEALKFYPIDTAISTANDFIAFAGSDLSDLLTAENYLGDGTATISVSTEEEDALGTLNYNGTSIGEFTFADGINYVKTSDLASNPDTISLKRSVDGTYTTQWAGEVAHLVPCTSETLVKWLNSPAVTGIQEQAFIEATTRNGRLQITAQNPGELGGVEIAETSVNGKSIEIIGSGDSTLLKANISRAFVESLQFGWCAIENSDNSPKTFLNITGASEIALAADGTVTFNANINTMTTVAPSNGTQVIIQKVGNFAIYLFPRASSVANLTGKWLEVQIDTATSSNNVTKRIIRSGTTTSSGAFAQWVWFWVENENAVTESVEFQSGDGDVLRYYHENSVMAEDQFEIGYELGSESNVGVFTVTEVTPNSGVFVVDTTFAPVASQVIGTSNFNSLRLRETPVRLIKKILSFGIDPDSSIDPTEPGISWVFFDEGALLNRISQTLGASIEQLGRLDFDTTPLVGTNGYNVTTGLIGEVARVLYGDLNAPTVYPGVVAAGASVNISGPNIKRIQVSLQLRLRTGVSQSAVLDRVRNSVATAINSIPLGTVVDISRIVSAARNVPGVAAVSVLSPTYSSSSDVIPVQANEKPFIFDATSDINLVIVT